MTGTGPPANPDLPPTRRLFDKLNQAFSSPGDALSQRVLHGGLWQLVQRGASRAVNFAQLVILARLLVPEDFGLFGIALLTQQTLDVLLRFGIDAALIQREERTEEYLNTAWTLKVLKAVIVGGCLMLVAPWVAAFFDAPDATPLIRFLVVVVLLRGLENIGAVYFRKELDFRKEFVLRFGEALTNALVAIVLAWLLGSVWALVIGMAAGAAVRLVTSYAFHPHRPRLELNGSKARDLWSYGKWLFGSSTFVYASTQGDDILLGRWLGTTALGIYQVAYRISNAVATEVTHVISSVTFPAYAKLQSAAETLRRGFLATFALTSLIVVPLAASIVIFIPEFVRYIIGQQWEEAIGPVRILAIAGLLRAFSACWGPLYRAQAHTEKPFWKNAIRLALTLSPAYPLTTQFGIEGMSICVVAGISGALVYDLVWAGTNGAVQIAAKAVIRELTGPVVATVGSVGMVVALQTVIGPGFANFLGLIAVYIIMYGLAIALLEAFGWRTGWARMLALVERVG